MSKEFYWAVGGMLEHARALNALLGPTVNCSKRYRKGTYAPASITWGFENRSVAVRVKAWRGHHLDIKSSSRTRRYAGKAVLDATSAEQVARMLPYLKKG